MQKPDTHAQRLTADLAWSGQLDGLKKLVARASAKKKVAAKPIVARKPDQSNEWSPERD